jgi:hypothetical protein
MEKPKIIEPEKKVIEEFQDLIKTDGVKIKRKILFTQGPVIKGRIGAWAYYRMEDSEDLIKSAKKSKKENGPASEIRKEQLKDYEFYLLVVHKNNPLSRLLFVLFGYGANYHLPDISFIENSDVDLSISIYAQQFRRYPHIYVYSEKGHKVIQNMVEHLTLNQVYKDTVNHIPQMHYFDYKTGKFVAKARELKELKAQTWKDRQENLEKESTEED